MRTPRLAALLLAGSLAIATAASAEVAVGFEQGLAGTVTGSTLSPAEPSCRARDLAKPPADRAGAAELAGVLGAIAPTEGASLLRLRTTGAGTADDLALTKWETTVLAPEAAILALDVAFATADRADFGDGWAILVDGLPAACGDVASMAVAGPAGIAPADRWTGWSEVAVPIQPGVHLLQAFVWDGVDSSGDSSLLLDAVRLEALALGPDCQPAPPGPVGEVSADTSTPTRWVFDDNRFCAGGPGVGCSRPGDGDPQPGTGFVNAEGLSFEMYIVADCGTEMHLPLNDVEGGCISVFDESRAPIPIHVTNGAGFDMTGGEVCWQAQFCDGQGMNLPGGPGNERIMDVSFQGSPALCGVYIVNFRSWAGCIWDLFANCDGTGTGRFSIYDDFCEAVDSVNPLPELIVQSLVLNDAGGCRVGYCATVRNIGCVLAANTVVHVSNGNDAEDHAVASLAAGATLTFCGTLDVPDTGNLVSTTVTAVSDFGNQLLECSEATDASSCEPATGADQLSRTRTVMCGSPPTCDAGGPYSASCSHDPATFLLDGTGSSDADGPVTFQWTTNCPGASIANPTSPTPTLTLPGESCATCTVFLTVRDNTNNTASCQAAVAVTDVVPPVLTCPPDTTVECPAPAGARQAWLESATGTDDCSDVVITRTLIATELLCDGLVPGLVRETWRFEAEDLCGMVAPACTATWAQDDTTPPTITPPSDLVVECPAPTFGPGSLADFRAAATCSDSCSACTVVTLPCVPTFGPCEDANGHALTDLTCEFWAEDACGNESAHVTASYRVVDTTPPALDPAPPPATVDCDMVPPAAVLAATDACDPSVPVTFTETRSNETCADTYRLTRTWEATDDCGNTATASQIVDVVDDEPPVLSGVPANTTVECPAPAPVANVTAEDDCDPMVDVVADTELIPGACPQEVVVRTTWTATDRCGNSVSATRDVAIVDTTPPTLSGVPASATVPCDLVPAPASPSADDACDPTPGITFAETEQPGTCPQERVITRTWTAADDCGNTATGTQVLTVVDDVAPTIAGVPADATVACDDVPAPASPTAADTCDPDPGLALAETEQPGACPQERVITRTWTATDACGNSTTRAQVLTVVDDVAPALDGVPADVTAECDDVPDAPAVTADDNCDPDPVVTFDEQRVDTLNATGGGGRSGSRRLQRIAPCPDEYSLHRTWTAIDACGNTVSATQVVTVHDTVAPVIDGVPPDVTVDCDDVPDPAQPTALDNCDPDPSLAFDEARTDGPCPDTYDLTRTWTATDRCANASTAVQVVHVRDVVAPSLSGVPADDTVECDAVPPPATPTASDACDSDPAVAMSETITPGSCPNRWTITRTWTATDACSNSSSESQVIEVEDTTPPVLIPPDDLTVECPEPTSGPQSEAGWLASASATDNCGPAVVRTRLVSDVPGCGATRVATWELWAEDACLLESSPRVLRTYRVVDTTPPEVAPPDDVTVECPPAATGPGSEEEWLASATASDACGDASVQHELVSSEDGCGDTFTHVHAFWAVDECGLESGRELRTYRVEDTTPPVFGGGSDPQFVFSIWPPNHGYVVYSTADVVGASDGCGAVVVQATGCTSSQPEEVHQGRTADGGNGDGRTFEDCVLSVDGTQFAVRAERLGACGRDSRRVYGIAFVATDECGNSTPGAGNVLVEHDRNTHQDVLRGRKLGPNDPPPFPYIHPTVYGPGCE